MKIKLYDKGGKAKNDDIDDLFNELYQKFNKRENIS